MNPPRVWITGAGGLLGSYLLKTAPQFAPDWRILGLRRGELDLTDFTAVRARFQADRPDAVIHCAAIAHPPACQREPEAARELNVEATRWLAELAADLPFFFYSSDLVFDGERGGYVETDAPNPVSVYAETKVAAEQIVLANPRHTVLRLSLNFGKSPTGNRAFNELLRNDLAAGKNFSLFTDEFRSPGAALVTARATWELLRQRAAGLFHVCGADKLSRWEIASLLLSRWPALPGQVQPDTIKNYHGPPRPQDSSMNCAKVQRLLPFRLPGMAEALAANPGEVA
ncbi:MAG: dTDP-4-dehydrorhamnose reductase [Limisphaerales bacterium]|nr:MAG: dTDP-4-dehydrorhamnose reductase [Limisphaerales bacterium]TXT48846.1 MAG: dTDP-4-dehydrorhamnose reductase [Limisphaerales bacterium]